MKQIYAIFCMFCIAPFVAHGNTCRAGYVVADIAVDSLITSFAGGCGTNSGYVPTIITNEFVYPISDHINCGAGQRYENGACVNNVQNDCASGYLDGEINDAFTFIQSIAGSCTTGYQPVATRQEISYLTNRGLGSAKCAVGYYPTANGCVAYPVDNCPDNYYAVLPNAAYVRAGSDGTCGTNYSASADTDICLRYMAPNIPDMCTPQLPCAGGANSLRTSTGVNLPVYGESVTTPSINIGFVNGTVCHVNMLPGAANNTVNIKYNNETYHGVE